MYYELTLSRENDKGKPVQERYIVSGCTLFAECECRAFETFANECDVTAIRRSPIREFANERGDKPFIFIATVADVFTKDDGSEKELLYKVALWASDIADAQSIAKTFMQQGLEDMRLKGINQTKFIDVL